METKICTQCEKELPNMWASDNCSKGAMVFEEFIRTGRGKRYRFSIMPTP